MANLRDRDTEGSRLLGWNAATSPALAAPLYSVNPGELAMPLRDALTLAISAPSGPMIVALLISIAFH